MALSSRTHSHTSTPALANDARFLLKLLAQFAPSSPLARFLLQSRKLALGKSGLKALGKLPFSAFKESDEIHLKSSSKKNRCRATLPNVFLGLDDEAIRQFLRAARDPKFLRTSLLDKVFYPTNKHFTISRIGRLFEAVVGDHHPSVLIRIANFRGIPARWPEKLLPNGGEWVLHPISSAAGSKPHKGSIFPFARRVCRDFRNWARDPSKLSKFDFLEPPEDLSPNEASAYQILREIVRLQENTGKKPISPTSLAKYLLNALDILESKEKRGKLAKATAPSKEALRRIKAACTSLKYERVDGYYTLAKAVERKLKLNLVPIRFLEETVFSKRPLVKDIAKSTSHVILLIDLFTGRRVSDFADVKFSDFSQHLGLLDLTISATKVRSMRGIKLPQHRLLPPPAFEYVKEWATEVLKQHSGNPQITLYELITGQSRTVGTPKDVASEALDRALVKSLNGDLTRLHVLRYSFGTWAPIAATLCWHPDLMIHPRIAPWVKDSLFFSDPQMVQWRDLSSSPTGDPFDVISRILGHTSTGELQRDYCISWTILADISAILVDHVQQF